VFCEKRRGKSTHGKKENGIAWESNKERKVSVKKIPLLNGFFLKLRGISDHLGENPRWLDLRGRREKRGRRGRYNRPGCKTQWEKKSSKHL